jgi:hypothetical protein
LLSLVFAKTPYLVTLKNKTMQKKALLITFSLLLLSFFACKQTDPPEPTCIDAKLEEFKESPFSAKIIKIDKPGGALYWLVDSVFDAGEEILNEQCEVVCVVDCECTGVVFCDAAIWDFPQETIWEK